MDTVVGFRFDWRGRSLFENECGVTEGLGKATVGVLRECLVRTMDLIRAYSRDFYHDLVGRRICLRVGDSESVIRLRPHDLLLNRRLLEHIESDGTSRDFLVAALELGFFHLCHPERHISEARLANLHFLDAHPDLLESTLRCLQRDDFGAEGRLWAAELRECGTLLLLERFWEWFGPQRGTQRILELCAHPGPRARSAARETLVRYAGLFAAERQLAPEAVTRGIAGFRHFFVEEGSAIFVYRLGRQVFKAVRVCRAGLLDAWSGGACASFYCEDVRTDLFCDHGRYIGPWLEQLILQSKDYSFEALSRMLQSEDLHTVNTAVDELVDRIQRKKAGREGLRLLYAALYYWHRNRRDISRAVGLRVSKILEDVLTERPASFPPSRVNRSIFRDEPVVVRVQIHKPYRTAVGNVAARIQWAINGHRKKPVAMEFDAARSEPTQLVFRAQLPRRTGWIHYAVQVSLDEGKSWKYEKFDPQSQGLLKSVADERGQRVLSFYCDTFNLKLDEHGSPVRDASGAYVYGTFDDLAEQLTAIQAEGYTRIYPLGALELGWAGEAGPDPSVFSIWDGRTVRRDMGGLEALLRLQAKAKELGMKVLLDVVSHFSRANTEYPYDMPVYIADGSGRLSRRAGWDGEWDEWRDSFMVNMRDLENVERLASLCEELTRLGFGLRFDVGHGFDTVFPVDERSTGLARTLGQVVGAGFEPIDLRGTLEPNISMLTICYRVQKNVPQALLAYSEQWHGNESRMIKSGTIPYNAVIKNLEHIRSGEPVGAFMGLVGNLGYLNDVVGGCGGQTLSLFNSHDEEAPASNYQNMIWPAAAFLVFSSYGPVMYHISRLPDERAGSYHRRFDLAYNECWKHWVNNRFSHPWADEARAREAILGAYPMLRGVGGYLRALYGFVDANPVLQKGRIHPVQTNNDRIAAFIRSHNDQRFLCVFNFPDPIGQGQQAVMREFNFPVRFSKCRPELEPLQVDAIYEFRERYNNVEGRMRRGKRAYWSGEELTQLGFGGTLAPVSSHVYEIVYRDHLIHERNVIPDSFLRYFRYGKDDRVRHSYIARAFGQAIAGRGRFSRFAELFTTTVAWLNRHRRLGIGELGQVLAEISEASDADRSKVTEFLLRVAVNETGTSDPETVRGAVNVLQSLNIGTIALVSPESRFSGSAGGVGIYTTDIADVLSELGFHVVIITPLYECDRETIISTFNPRYEGHSFSIHFPSFDESTQSIGVDPTPDVVNLLRSRLTRTTHGRRSRVDVLYVENAKYFDRPYGGSTSEDKLRRARLLSQGALEALRRYNYYPAIIQMNEWPTWLVGAYLTLWSEFRDDPHFSRTQACSMMHNPHPAYSIVLDEHNPVKRDYYCRVIGLDPAFHWQVAINPESYSGHELDLMHAMLTTSKFVGTVSKAMRQRILDEPWLFGHSRLFREKAENGRFFARRNGFNMAARQRFWFGTKRSILETYDNRARRRLFRICLERKAGAKLLLQGDPRINLTPDGEVDHVVFGMLHRISRQKGFELLVDWKVYEWSGHREIRFEPWNMHGTTVLEYFLLSDPRIQYVIAGRVEDSPDGRRFDMHFQRISWREDLKGRFAYLPQGTLPPALYRNLYLGSQYFVMPSGGEVGEPCGISQQEAHAGGTPVIAHHQDGLQRTVSDKDFGDTAHATNGIKFSGFTGESLLEALLDGVEVYYNNRRRKYRDPDGQPRRLRYRDMCFNAFHSDHRWLRLLRDYIDMYAEILAVALPEHLDAARLISEMQFIRDGNLGDVVLKMGMDMPLAADKLVAAMGSEITSLRRAAAGTLLRLSGSPGVRGRVDIRRRLLRAVESDVVLLRETAAECLKQFDKQRVRTT